MLFGFGNRKWEAFLGGDGSCAHISIACFSFSHFSLADERSETGDQADPGLFAIIYNEMQHENSKALLITEPSVNVTYMAKYSISQQ